MQKKNFKRMEQKYLFPAGYETMLLIWLEHVCVPDNKYPLSDIYTLYYDTPELYHFYENRNGDFLKTKIRLRWYSHFSPSQNGSDVLCYLEIKRKEGTLSLKERIEMVLPFKVLSEGIFSDDRILDIPSGLLHLEYKPENMLVPVLLVQYRRRRYIDTKPRCPG